MKYLCAWCGCQLRETTPEQGQAVSHGVCEACLPRALGEARAEEPKSEPVAAGGRSQQATRRRERSAD